MVQYTRTYGSAKRIFNGKLAAIMSTYRQFLVLKWISMVHLMSGSSIFSINYLDLSEILHLSFALNSLIYGSVCMSSCRAAACTCYSFMTSRLLITQADSIWSKVIEFNKMLFQKQNFSVHLHFKHDYGKLSTCTLVGKYLLLLNFIGIYFRHSLTGQNLRLARHNTILCQVYSLQL